MIHSMTGFASLKGQAQGFVWTWDLRSVNSKGLDIRLRVPDWVPGLEQGVRGVLSKGLARGSVSLSLKLTREEQGSATRLNETYLSEVMAAMARVEADAMEEGLSLAPSTAAEILSLKGIMDSSGDADAEVDDAALAKTLLEQMPQLIADLVEMRRGEGDKLAGMLSAQLDTLNQLIQDAETAVAARSEDTSAALKRNLAKVLDAADQMDEARIAQELALIAVKSDVTEELDRLRAHVAAARDLIAKGGVVGRKFDFLMQEFNREANTLCSKAQNVGLTEVGLDMKTLIDQMREQVQNVE